MDGQASHEGAARQGVPAFLADGGQGQGGAQGEQHAAFGVAVQANPGGGFVGGARPGEFRICRLVHGGFHGLHWDPGGIVSEHDAAGPLVAFHRQGCGQCAQGAEQPLQVGGLAQGWVAQADAARDGGDDAGHGFNLYAGR